MPTCPICKKTAFVRPSSPRSGDWLRRLFVKSAFRCKGCSYRFFAAPDRSTKRVLCEPAQPSDQLTPVELAALNAERLQPKVFDFRDFGVLPLDLKGDPLQDVPAITFDFKTLRDKVALLTEYDVAHIAEKPKEAGMFDSTSLMVSPIHVNFEDDVSDLSKLTQGITNT